MFTSQYITTILFKEYFAVADILTDDDNLYCMKTTHNDYT